MTQDIATEISRLQTTKANLKTSIEAKGVTVPSSTTIDGYPALVDQIQQGGGDEELKDVVYFDYDGTPVYQYTKEEFALLTEHPANPTHAGLTAQGWNWSLADAKTYVATYGMLDIGQMYVTDDGKTRLYITLEEGYLEPTLFYYQSASKGVTIDWGDGTTTSPLDGSGYKNIDHTYAAPGNYVIKLSVSSGGMMLGNQTPAKYIFAKLDNNVLKYNKVLKKVEYGNDVTNLGNYAFQNCTSLETVTIPNTINNYAAYAFQYCTSLKYLTIGTGCNYNGIQSNVFNWCTSLKYVSLSRTMTSLGGSMFQYCHSLKRASIPDTVTTINGNTFFRCYSLTRVSIPNTVTSIGNNTFVGCKFSKITIPGVNSTGSTCVNECNNLKEVIIKSGVTTIGNTGVSANISLEKITIPNGVTTIGISAFASNTSLLSLTIPSTVTSIGTYAFNGNISCREYYFYPTTPPTLAHAGRATFGGISPACVIYVPAASVEAYKTAQYWSDVASYIQAMPE